MKYYNNKNQLDDLIHQNIKNNDIVSSCDILNNLIKVGRSGEYTDIISMEIYDHIFKYLGFDRLLENLDKVDGDFKDIYQNTISKYQKNAMFNSRILKNFQIDSIDFSNNDLLFSVVFKELATKSTVIPLRAIYLRISDIFGRSYVKKCIKSDNTWVQVLGNVAVICLKRPAVIKCNTNSLRFHFNYFFAFEPGMYKFISDFEEGDTIIDVGANIGIYSIASYLLKNTNTFSIEPFAENFASLQGNIDINGFNDFINPLQIAISNYDGVGELLYNAENTKPGVANQSLGFEGKDEADSNRVSRPVDVQKIDSFVLDKKINNNYHIKIDVDGSEWRLINGMEESLRDKNLKSIRLEVRLNSEEKNVEYVNKMIEAGFELYVGDDLKNLNLYRY